jgi:PAS domain S-box-containing protein
MRCFDVDDRRRTGSDAGGAMPGDRSNLVEWLNAATTWMFDPGGLTPHGFCLLWNPGLIWTYAISDVTIGIAYFTIPLALASFAQRRRDLVFRPVLLLFAAFILLCGATHWIDVLTLWIPAYGLEGVFKAATAGVSVDRDRLVAADAGRADPAVVGAAAGGQRSPARKRSALSRRLQEFACAALYAGRKRRNYRRFESWLALIGYDRDEVVGRPIRAFMAAGSTAESEPDLRDLIAKGEARDLDRRFLRKDGDVIEALVSARLERLEDRTWIVCAVNDVTARRRAEAALRASEENLHQIQKIEALGQLTGGIAHDFNNMLQGIGGYLELIERRIAQGRGEEVGRYADAARQSLDRAAALTNRMLAFARRQALQSKPVDPDALVHGMAELISRSLGPSVAFEFRLRDGVWKVFCDPTSWRAHC